MGLGDVTGQPGLLHHRQVAERGAEADVTLGLVDGDMGHVTQPVGGAASAAVLVRARGLQCGCAAGGDGVEPGALTLDGELDIGIGEVGRVHRDQSVDLANDAVQHHDPKGRRRV